jgi:formyl-CoA transferase
MRSMTTADAAVARSLACLKVLEPGPLIVGPFSGKTRCDVRAAVIKVEQPAGGDPLCQWRTLHEGTRVWWQVPGLHQRSVVLDRHTQAMLGRLNATPRE